MKKALIVSSLCIGIFFITTLLIGLVLGPIYTLVCDIWALLLGYDTKYPACYYPHWWNWK